MPFGALAPFPLRLGAQSNTSISPENWLRLCDDVVQQNHPLAVLLITEPAETSGPCTVTGLFLGGTDPGATITAQLDEMATDNSYLITVSMGSSYIDSTSGERKSWALKMANARHVGATTVDDVYIYDTDIEISYTVVRSGARQHTLVVYGETAPKYSGDYGAEPTKSSAGAAADIPYAWIWLQEAQAIRGDAFSTAPGSYTQIENIAIARMFAYTQNLADRLAASQLPMQADQAIDYWASLMNVGTTDDRDWQARRKCAAKFALVTVGANTQSLNAAASLVFGSNFVRIDWNEGTLDSPPPNTFWPGGTSGPAGLNIGDGYAWTSTRHRFSIILTSLNNAETTRLMSVNRREFDEMLIDVMPPVNVWDYKINQNGDGFELSVDRMGFDEL
jgi:hypothetical protein